MTQNEINLKFFIFFVTEETLQDILLWFPRDLSERNTNLIGVYLKNFYLKKKIIFLLLLYNDSCDD